MNWLRINRSGYEYIMLNIFKYICVLDPWFAHFLDEAAWRGMFHSRAFFSFSRRNCLVPWLCETTANRGLTVALLSSQKKNCITRFHHPLLVSVISGILKTSKRASDWVKHLQPLSPSTSVPPPTPFSQPPSLTPKGPPP